MSAPMSAAPIVSTSANEFAPEVTYECYDLGVSVDAYDRMLLAMAEVHAEHSNVACHSDTFSERPPFVMPAAAIAIA